MRYSHSSSLGVGSDDEAREVRASSRTEEESVDSELAVLRFLDATIARSSRRDDHLTARPSRRRVAEL